MKSLVLTGVVRMRKEMDKTERIQAALRLNMEGIEHELHKM